MKGISLWQPWASLLVHGIKKYETRPKCFALFGEPIYVQAALKLPKDSSMNPALLRIVRAYFGDDWRDKLPRGAIIGVVVFGDRTRSNTERKTVSAAEIALGNWDDGRQVYRVSDACAFAQPIPCAGKQAVPFLLPAAVAEAIAARGGNL